MKDLTQKQKLAAIAMILVLCYAGILLIAHYHRTWDRQAGQIGQALFPDLDVNNVDRVVLTDAAGKLVIRKDSGQWIVDKQNGYPADFYKLKQMIKAMHEARVLNSYSVNEGGISKLKLVAPGGQSKNTGCLIQLFDSNNEPLAGLIVGTPHMNKNESKVADARYARAQGSFEAVILRYQFREATTDGPTWIDRSFPSTKCARRIVLRRNGKKVWELTRENKSRLMKVPGLVKGMKMEQEAVSRLEHALAFAKYSQLGDPTAPMNVWNFKGRHFQFEDFDGIRYTLDLGAITTDALMPVRVSVELVSKENASKELQERLQREKRLYKGWVYLLPRATFTPFLMKRQSLVKGSSDNDQTGFQEFPDEK